MALTDDLAATAAAAQRLAADGEALAGVLAAEAAGAARTYLCAFARGEERAWLVLDAAGEPVTRRGRVRDTASIVAVCELAEETAGGGRLEELRGQLASLRLTEAPEGIEEAEDAALALERTIGAPPRIASPAWLDTVGAASVELERALGQPGASPFAEAMKAAVGLVESFVREVEERYKLELV
ncbi:MAG TPA: hypothetical protein VFI37_13020 [Gaiellaceae bacterium]|nr:hypothetical protein [Gaiellaceae bacterium]